MYESYLLNRENILNFMCWELRTTFSTNDNDEYQQLLHMTSFHENYININYISLT